MMKDAAPSSGTQKLRPPAVPLVTIDPYFNVWSMADRLYDDHTRHWTGKRHGMNGMIAIDGAVWRFMGKNGIAAEGSSTDSTNANPPRDDVPALEQVDLTVHATSTIYTFQGGGIRLEVDFTTPLLLDDLDLLSRPASYISFTAVSIDGQSHRIQIYVDVTAEWCVDTPAQSVVFGKKALSDGSELLFAGTEAQPILEKTGDDRRIDWGYIHLAVPGGRSQAFTAYGPAAALRNQFIEQTGLQDVTDLTMPCAVKDAYPALAVAMDLGSAGDRPISAYVMAAYDDILSVEYFHVRLPAYWKRNHAAFEQVVMQAAQDYDAVMARCAAFNRQLRQDALAAGGPLYADLLSLAYRQAIAAHKLVADQNGNVLFFSKENFSNGCMGTVDVSYPSVPLFLLYNPELAKGMMRPIFRYAASEEWPFDFAPHDVGQYPKANGQVYGQNQLKYQMPVEECGNMLIMAAAVCKMENDVSFFKENENLLDRWANYLLEHGLDPENQLCTDDFSGHLAHNANLSVKAIMGIASYALLRGMAGEPEEERRLMDIARSMAREWERMARDGDHYKLTFDMEGTWSLKYNMIWDVLFGFDLFPEEVKEKEVSYYLQKQNRYGVPLDHRAAHTKADWIFWAASLTNSDDKFAKLIRPVWDFLHETPNRVPFSDWYDTETGKHKGFVNRSVVGGLFIKLLKSKLLPVQS